MALKEIKIFLQHGKQFVPDLRKTEIKPPFRGFPIIDKNISEQEAEQIKNICPSMAIKCNPFSIDLGKCVFCSECQFALPTKIKFSNEHRLSAINRSDLIVEAGATEPKKIDRSLIRKEIKTIFKNALKLRQVSAGGDNSAEMELNAAGNVNFDMGRFGIEFVASPRHADGIVITGPITENMAEPLQICYDAIPSPKLIILCGTDAISGGMFAGSNAVNRSFLDSHTVDLYVPGNPPHPLTFINGVLDLIGK